MRDFWRAATRTLATVSTLTLISTLLWTIFPAVTVVR